MEFCDTSCRDLIAALSGSDPVPGGGGASALVGAIGTALGRMVGALTVGKPKYAAVDEKLSGAMEQATALQASLLSLMDRDAEVFLPLMEAYRLPKDTEAAQQARQTAVEAGLVAAAAVPLELMQQLCKSIDLIAVFAENGAPMALSDAGCGAILCKAALQSASLNVFINTKSMLDQSAAAAINREAQALLSDYLVRADDIFLAVQNRYL